MGHHMISEIFKFALVEEPCLVGGQPSRVPSARMSQMIDLPSTRYTQCTITGWWFGTWLLFSIMHGIILPIDFHIFQRGRSTTNQIIREVYLHVAIVPLFSWLHHVKVQCLTCLMVIYRQLPMTLREIRSPSFEKSPMVSCGAPPKKSLLKSINFPWFDHRFWWVTKCNQASLYPFIYIGSQV